MLVRCRRLVWVDSGGDRFAAEYRGRQYRVNLGTSGRWRLIYLDHTWNEFETREEAQEDAQRDADGLWLADTEVVPLEWESTEDFYFSAIGWGRRYEVVQACDGQWWYSFRESPSVKCESADDGKAHCNAHNRDLVLGKAG